MSETVYKVSEKYQKSVKILKCHVSQNFYENLFLPILHIFCIKTTIKQNKTLQTILLTEKKLI